MNQLQGKRLIESFLLEDIGSGDLSSRIFSNSETVKGRFVAKAAGVLAGCVVMNWVYDCLGERVHVHFHKRDGEWIRKGDVIATVEGDVATLLTGERVILNLMQRMSGIATMTHQAVDQLGESKTRICDTRKTAPGLRLFDKYAVTCGGGYNHRFGLYDGVMLKDNHIAYAGSISKAVERIREKVGHMVKIEVEVESKAQVKEAVAAEVDIIMLDNFEPEALEMLILLIPDQIVAEASGGITLENLSTFRDCGLDYISLGCLTHSVNALDISFNIKGGNKWIY
ncbi:MAG: carboxylating nicotinate-nucleotide diphosphorylase [Defluviitaleaceae bacterium]|nr:carboxylating nicotinate-nucleotide diphosphorylase [Defluviitaleaceae bacterium]